MREALVILAVMGILLILTAVRYRRQIAAGVQIWRSLKEARQQINRRTKPPAETRPVDSGKLVNCAKCSTWVPENRAIKLRGGSYFCSSTCVESVTGTTNT